MDLLKSFVKDQSPDSFALVMATGICSIGAHLIQLSLISNGLFWFNLVLYGLLLTGLLLRLLFFFAHVKADLDSPHKGTGFLTLVAATSIVGIQSTLLKQAYPVATLLWVSALGLWLLLMYAFLLLSIVRNQKSAVENTLDGGWLLLVVATQSVSILGTTLSAHLELDSVLLHFFSISTYCLGLTLYVILISLIFYRMTFLPFKADEFKVPYWITMGAAAISTLAGATLLESLHKAAQFAALVPFLTGASLLSWAVSSWWIALLVSLSIWWYRAKRTVAGYAPHDWALVFCLGMYTVGSWRLAEALAIPFLQPIAHRCMYLVLAIWLLMWVKMSIHVLQSFRFSKVASAAGNRSDNLT